jgi:hypothetical protein
MIINIKKILLFALIIFLFLLCECNEEKEAKYFFSQNKIKAILYKTTSERSNEVLINDLNTKVNKKIILPENYDLYDILVIDDKNFIISFQKKNDYDVLYSGILKYSITDNVINEIFKTNLLNHIYFKMSLSFDKNSMLFYDGEKYQVYDLINNTIKNFNKNNASLIYYFNNLDGYVIQDEDKSEIYIKSKLYMTVNQIDSPLFINPALIFNSMNKRYYFLRLGRIYLINENGKEIEINISDKRLITKVLSFDNSGRFLFFDGIGEGEYRYLGVIDIVNMKVYNLDISLLGGYDLVFDDK